MAISRYDRDTIIGVQKRFATAQAVPRIRSAIKSGRLATQEIVIVQGQRLDHIAKEYYGDGAFWWVIAAASDVGWWLQVPPGTRILIPIDINKALELV